MWAYGLGEPVARAFETFGALARCRPPRRVCAGASGLLRHEPGARRDANFVKYEKESGDSSSVTYPPGEFAERLAVLAAMLHNGMPIKCVSLNAPGSYDTHSGEAGTLSTNLEQTVAALLAFQRDLEPAAWISGC